MYSAKKQLKFTYRIIGDTEFDLSELKEKFPILTKKESLKALNPYLTISQNNDKFVICIHKFYISIGVIDTKILIDKMEIIRNSLSNTTEKNTLQQLVITIFPETDQFGCDIPAEILRYLSDNNISLSLSGIFL